MENEKLLKNYPNWYKKYEEYLADLFRNKKSIAPISVVMILLFVVSMLNDIQWPFIVGVLFIGFMLIYFKIWPLSWNEMNDKEKDAYRNINQLPSTWEPK